MSIFNVKQCCLVIYFDFIFLIKFQLIENFFQKTKLDTSVSDTIMINKYKIKRTINFLPGINHF